MPESNPSFIIQRKYILGLGKWMQSLSLSGRDSRERTKFVEMLDTELKEADLVRVEIVKKYAEVDESTKELVVKEENGSSHYVIPDEKMPEFSTELKSYLEEEFTISGAGNKNRLLSVKRIVLDTTEKIDPAISEDYSNWCDAFEKVEE